MSRLDPNNPPLTVRLTVEHMRTEIVQLLSGAFDAWSDKERLAAIVQLEIDAFDFEGEIRRVVRMEIEGALRLRARWVAEKLVRDAQELKGLEQVSSDLFKEAVTRIDANRAPRTPEGT